jgi:hypothetical protein
MNMVKIVDLPMRSPRNSQAIIAVKNGIELRVNVVAATVVFVIAIKKQILAHPISIAAKIPCNPIPLSCCGPLFPYRKSKTIDIASPNAIDL